MCLGLDIWVSEVVEAYPFQPCPLQYTLEHVQDAVRRHRASMRGREHVLAGLVHALEDLDGIRSYRDIAVRVFRFQRCLHHLAVLPEYLTPDVDNSLFEINIAPFQPQQFSSPEVRCRVDVVELEHAAAPRLLEEGAEAFRRQYLHFLLL